MYNQYNLSININTMAIDFITYQLQSTGGKEYHQIPGVLVENAARTTQRHRQGDLLALFLSFSGEHRYINEEIDDLTKTASGIFFHTQGSVTRAIQLIIEDLNKRILERNLDRGYEGIQAEGSVNITVLHNGWLFMGQVGDAQTYTIGPERFERYGEDGDTTEKLGRSKRIQPRLYQCELQAGDLILMSPHAHASWKAYYLSGSTELTMPQVKRRLQNQMIQDFSVLAIKTEEGNGKVHDGIWKIEEEKSSKVEEEHVHEDQPGIETDELEQDIHQEAESALNQMEGDIQITEEETPDLQEVIHIENSDIQVTAGETEQIQPGQQDKRGVEKKSGEQHKKWLIGLARLWMRGKTLRAKLQFSFGKFKRKFTPKKTIIQTSESFTWMTIAALAIPLIIILSSLTVYTRFGEEEQYNIFIDEAQATALLAEDEDDAIKQHDYWKDVLALTTNAEEYLVTNESRQLFQKAQSTMDEMDLTARLDFRPALTQFFPDGASISRIKASSSGVYLLDNNSGNVLRIYLNTKGFYQLDEEFKCTPGPYGLVTVTEIIDFIILPANSENYKIMALDEQGNLLYCQPGELPVSRTLTMPEGGWDRIIGTAYANDVLYVIDAGRSMVWVYEGTSTESTGMSGIVFAESPNSFFDENIPDLGGAVDASINQEDLYILHDDGHMTLCQYSLLKEVKLTECEDPAPFTDNRVGIENTKPWIFMGTHFIGMEQTRLPNASLFLLDDISGALYQFSYQLNLERTLKPQTNRNYPLPASSPSGFGITPDQEVFLAYGNQLYIAPMK
jgi:hypothetical protein